MSRPDQSIAFLRSHGFSVFRFPRASAQPLELMHREGKDLTRLGMAPDLVTAGDAALPAVRRDASPGIDIDGKETSKVNVAIGVVKAGRISPHIPAGTIEKLLDDEVYVVTSVLKTKKIVVSAQGENGAAAKVDVPIIQQAVGGNLSVQTEGTQESRVAFEGTVPVAFAFQAVQLVFDDSGEFLTTQQLPAGDAAARTLSSPRAMHPPGERGPVFLEARGVFVRVGHGGGQ